MCDFKMFTLNDLDSVELGVSVAGPLVDATYDGQKFEIMEVEIDEGAITTVTFVVYQQTPAIRAEGRLWCRNNTHEWTAFKKSGNKLTYATDVPASVGGTVGYELRFALEGVADDQVVWVDPKVIISRKGQVLDTRQQAAR